MGEVRAAVVAFVQLLALCDRWMRRKLVIVDE